VRFLRDLAERRRLRIAARRDDLAHERLPRHDTHQLLLVVADEDRAHLGPREQVARILGGRAGREPGRLRQHRVADEAHG